MKTVAALLMCLLITAFAAGQESLHGVVLGSESGGSPTPVAGASVYWMGTARGTVTDTAGGFILPLVGTTRVLIVRHAAYTADTLTVGEQTTMTVRLRAVTREVEGVEVVGRQQATVIDYLSAASVQRMTQKELAKAACCNLSESFETNPSIDVSFTDAITGTRQIEMLGLSGIYTQTSLENMPYIRGLTSNVGLTFIPGTWIKSINVSKGIGSVANGYESITGQIDIDLRKPEDTEEKRAYLNLYGNMDARFEGNLNLRQQLGEHWSTMTLLHASSQQRETDKNGDLFLDMPVFTTFNAVQRLKYADENGWAGQLVVQFVDEKKEGGTRQSPPQPDPASAFLYGTRSQYLRLSGKTGHVFEGKPYQSFGVQWSLGRYRTSASYGPREYSGTEGTGYVNMLYQSILGSTMHVFRTGLSFLFDTFDERFEEDAYVRSERVPGAFFEYTYSPVDELTVVAGVRVDRHNAYGTMLTPRLHVRYAPIEDWVIRAVAGRGSRTANIFTEHATVFASTRAVSISPVGTFGYGLDQEVAWNYGINLTHYFLIDYREATLSLDAYRTVFDKQVVADLDSYPREIRFSSVTGGSYANSVQAELNMQPAERLETRIAYRYLDVRQQLNGIWLQRPLTAQHRALINIAYATEREGDDDPQTTYDLTVQWFGPKRIPSTSTNPEGLRAREASPSFATLNAQVTRTLFAGMELYLGGENLLDFKQDDPILDPGNPSSPYFDASLVWGPVSGRMVYAGVRFKL
jgi:outer membrane receptor for ferrienterochelin and colicins